MAKANKLTDYLSIETIRQLQDDFSAAVGAPVRVCDSEGRPFSNGAAEAPAVRRGCDAPVVFNGDVIGRIVCEDTGGQGGEVELRHASMVQSFLKLMAAQIVRLCDRQKQLHTRVRELATLYRLTAEFTGQHDIQAVLDLVAGTVVDVLHAKACSIRLLNENRTELVIKAVANLSPEYLEKGPILVSESMIDQQVLNELQPVYIADERDDPRVLYPAEATREGLISALCAPLVYKQKPEGVIHVYTGRPHRFDWYEISLLQAICAQAAAAIVNARLYEEAVHSAEARRQLRLAGEVQRRMVPSGPPEIPGIQIASQYVSCFEVGGDFYDFIPLAGGVTAMVVCDVVGKGVRASLLMASIRSLVRAHASGTADISEILSRVNRDLSSATSMGDFATLFLAVIDPENKIMRYASAGHVPPVLFRGGKTRELSRGGGLLGIDAEWKWESEELSLESGDYILTYTDGLSEAMNFDEETFGRERLIKSAQTAIADDRTADGLVRHLLWAMRSFTGLHERFDDLTIVALKVL